MSTDERAEAVRADLLQYLRQGREALLWKLDGLGEYDVRRPLTPTCTSLLGLVKHLSIVEARPNWQVSVFPTGALPYFELPQRFCAAYADFLATAGRERGG